MSERAGARAELGLALLEAGDVTAADVALRTSRAEFIEGQVRPSPDVLDVEVGLARVALSQGKKAKRLRYWTKRSNTGANLIRQDWTLRWLIIGVDAQTVRRRQPQR